MAVTLLARGFEVVAADIDAEKSRRINDSLRHWTNHYWRKPFELESHDVVPPSTLEKPSLLTLSSFQVYRTDEFLLKAMQPVAKE
jgi:hypothetical protein